MIKSKILVLFMCIACTFSASVFAVVLDDTSRVEVTLANGTTVLLYGEDTGGQGKPPTQFYYLPANLNLAQYPDGTPQFLFLKFTGDDAETPQGALLHFLMTWGLTEPQKRRVESRLQEQYSNARVAGAVPLELDEGGSFSIVSGTIGQEQFIYSGRAPVVAGSRVAAAARMDSVQAALMEETLDNMAIGDISVTAVYAYTTLAPGIKATIEIDWSRYGKEYESLEAKYTGSHKRGGILPSIGTSLFGSSGKKRTYTENREQFKFLRENGIATVTIEQYQNNEVTNAATEAVMQYFLNASSQLAEPDDELPPPTEEEKKRDPNIRKGHEYTYKRSYLRTVNEQKSQKLTLNGRVPLRHAITVTGNIRDWYDSVKDNRRNVSSVNISQPFFDIRPINFIIDLDAKDIFQEAINFVTVNVRKKRSTGHDFEDHLTIDQKYLEQNGVRASTSYARGEDTNSDVFEYQSIWSLRGGGQYPPNPAWQPGSWESVSLAPPVAGRTIDVEADLEELRAADITRATIQIRYPRLGSEEKTNIALSPGEGISMKSERVITDVDAKGYAYRVILNHKTQGKLALPWSAKLGDDYVYVSIPEEFSNPQSVEFVAAQTAGKQILENAEDKILEKFSELLN